MLEFISEYIKIVMLIVFVAGIIGAVSDITVSRIKKERPNYVKPIFAHIVESICIVAGFLLLSTILITGFVLLLEQIF